MRTPPWFLPAILSMLLWGVWGVFQKMATEHMPPRSVYLLSASGAIAVVLVMLFLSRFPIQSNFEGSFFAVLAGICSSLGGLMFLNALGKGEASIIITFTALYPVVSIMLSFLLLHETITLKQGIGIVLALFSLALLV